MSRTVRAGALLSLALLAGRAAAQAPEVRLPFDPAIDGLPFRNFGDYSNPGGNCYGMSLLAIDNYVRRARRGFEVGRSVPVPGQ